MITVADAVESFYSSINFKNRKKLWQQSPLQQDIYFEMQVTVKLVCLHSVFALAFKSCNFSLVL